MARYINQNGIWFESNWLRRHPWVQPRYGPRSLSTSSTCDTPSVDWASGKKFSGLLLAKKGNVNKEIQPTSWISKQYPLAFISWDLRGCLRQTSTILTSTEPPTSLGWGLPPRLSLANRLSNKTLKMLVTHWWNHSAWMIKGTGTYSEKSHQSHKLRRDILQPCHSSL